MITANPARTLGSRKFFLRGPFLPSHEENRMAQEGQVAAARQHFFAQRPKNLYYLLKKRYTWMNQYIAGDANVLELGSGAGFAKEFIQQGELTLTDYVKHPWIDVQADALDPPFADGSFDVVICSHMIHHLAQPAQFFRRVRRLLRRDGYLLIQEINTSYVMRLLLWAMRHEGWSYDVDVFDPDTIANRADDPWSANCAIPELLFHRPEAFQQNTPGFEVVLNRTMECFLFPLSGGVIAKTKTINLPFWALRIVDGLDSLLGTLMPGVFALGRSVALKAV